MIDSYVAVTWADEYFSKRPNADAWESKENKEALLVSASDFLDDHYPLKGGLNEKMRSGRAEIPPQVMRAVCELAINPNLSIVVDREEMKVKVGPIAIEYGDGSSSYAESFSNIPNILRGLLEVSTAIGYLNMARG